MVVQRSQLLSVEEWRAGELASRDVKHEYIGGRAYAMLGGSLTHGRIGANVVRVLEDALAAAHQSCYVYNSDVSVRLSAQHYTYPDASVTCDERDTPAPDKTEVIAPRIIVEVLSDSTEANDRGKKLQLYRLCLTVQEYMLVASKEQAVEIYRRTGDVWIYEAYGPENRIELASLGISLSAASLYRNAGVSVPDNLN